jgi:protein-L-isoaspartate(D-aspartate) O-methyltransferase
MNSGDRLLDDHERQVRIADLILRLRRLGVTDPDVVGAIESVPRELFVPPEWRGEAYSERALPIECGQTMTAPAIVGMMTAALAVRPTDRVLEVGTGSGYQTAILARLAARVYTVDRFRTLVAAAESRFKTLRLTNIVARVGDGTLGWPEHAPYDRIVVTAAADDVPDALTEQLALGGILVMPVGPPDDVQKLMRLEKGERGFQESPLADVRFVPIIPGVAERL